MSAKKFKVGDVVRLINGKKYSLYTENNNYIVVEGNISYSDLEATDRIDLVLVNSYPKDFELVQEEQKAMQNPQGSPITDEMILVVLGKLDDYARDYDSQEYGLPFHGVHRDNMMVIIKEALGILTERDKQIKQLQDIAGIDREQAEKLIEAGVIINV